MARPTTSTRWVVAILVVALLASVLVVVGLIQITGESPASSPPGSESGSSSGSAGSASSSPASTGPDPSPSPRPSGPVTLTSPSPTAVPVQLPGSGLTLPAAWTGTADLTITVHGRCAETGGTSLYTRPAQFALQVAPTSPVPATPTGRPAGSAGPSGSASGVPSGPTGAADPGASPGPVPDAGAGGPSGSAAAAPPADPVSMTVGITPTDVPGLSMYSTSSGRDGSIRRTWTVRTQADPDVPGRTLISATLIDDQPVGGLLPPNLLVDSETDLQPCEAGTGVRLPRPLAGGSTVTGWVSPTEAALEVDATTTDGERSVRATMTLTRDTGS
jgi:hypothetical protein